MKRAAIISVLLAVAVAKASVAAESAFSIRLVEPPAHIALLAGSTASISWEASEAPDAVDEWEAFLSIDGGQTFPVRLTPHLDRSIRRFTWHVPSLPGAEVTLLLRFGDEGDERGFTFVSRTRIKGIEHFDSLPLERVESSSADEEDDHGQQLVEWMAGSRDGSHLRRMAAVQSRLVGRHELAAPGHDDALPAPGLDSKRFDSTPLLSRAMQHALASNGRINATISRKRRTDLLALCSRLNI